VENNAFAGGPLDWLTPFSLFTGASLVVGYALLGACWLVMKTHGALQARARRLARPLLLGLLAAIAVVSVATPLLIPRIAERWFTLPNALWLSPVPVLSALAVLWCWRTLRAGAEVQPFLAAVTLFLLAYAGLVISNVPYLVPPTITVWDAAAAPASQVFVLIGTVLLLPIVLGYTAFVYWVFRGKVGATGYH
jgi:cytochrome d ubiquinol oxidase subunit II